MAGRNAQPILRAGCLSKKTPAHYCFMRNAALLLALTASAALHASLLMFVPGADDAHNSTRLTASSATTPLVQRIAIVAHLKNTLDSTAPRNSTAKLAPNGRTTRATSVVRRPRLDNAQRFYPPEAVAQGLEGETILMLTYRADGTLLDAKVAKSSGYAILDQAALRAIRAAPRMAAGQREILFPVTFALQ
jgi:protein TonB